MTEPANSDDASDIEGVETSTRTQSGPIETETSRPSATDKAASDDLRAARLMYYVGFFFLPGVWFICWWHFRNVVRSPNTDSRLLRYVMRSRTGALLGALIFCTWVVTVQLTWRTWGEFGRSLMLVVPADSDEL